MYVKGKTDRQINIEEQSERRGKLVVLIVGSEDVNLEKVSTKLKA